MSVDTTQSEQSENRKREKKATIPFMTCPWGDALLSLSLLPYFIFISKLPNLAYTQGGKGKMKNRFYLLKRVELNFYGQKKRDRIKINEIRNEREVTTYTKDIQRILRNLTI